MINQKQEQGIGAEVKEISQKFRDIDKAIGGQKYRTKV